MLKAFPLLVDEIVSTANLYRVEKYELHQVWSVFFSGVKDKSNMNHKVKEWTKADLERNLRKKYNDPVVAIQYLANTEGLFRDCIASLVNQIPLGEHLFGEDFFGEFIDYLQDDFGSSSPIQTTKGEYEWLGKILGKASKTTSKQDSTLIVTKILDLLLLNALLGPNEYLFTALGASEEIVKNTPPPLSKNKQQSTLGYSSNGNLILKGVYLPNGPTQPFESTNQEWICEHKTIIAGRRPSKKEYSADIEIPVCSFFHIDISRNQLLIKFDYENQQWEARNLSNSRPVTIVRRGDLNPDFHYVLQCSQGDALNSCSLAYGDIIYFDNESLSLRIELKD